MRWFVVKFNGVWAAAPYAIGPVGRAFRSWREAYDYAHAQTVGDVSAYSQH